MSGDVVDITPRLNPAVQPRKGDIRAIAIAAEQWDGDEWVPLPTDDDTERTVAWSRTAAEAVRAANHAADHAPTGDPWNVYSRCGELRELLAHTEQLVEVLADQAGRLNGTPGLYADDALEDVQRANLHAASAAAMLTSAAGHIGSARELVNDAFSALSHLRVRPS